MQERKASASLGAARDAAAAERDALASERDVLTAEHAQLGADHSALARDLQRARADLAAAEAGLESANTEASQYADAVRDELLEEQASGHHAQHLVPSAIFQRKSENP